MTEQEARARIIAWAKERFEWQGKIAPDVEVVGIHYEPEYDVWDAQLSVSTSADDPYVTFIEDDRQEHGIQVSHVEY